MGRLEAGDRCGSEDPSQLCKYPEMQILCMAGWASAAWRGRRAVYSAWRQFSAEAARIPQHSKRPGGLGALLSPRGELWAAGGPMVFGLMQSRRYRVLTRKDIPKIPQLQCLAPEHLEAILAVSCVLPFRVNQYVLDELIDWERVPDDPVFQLTFPQPGMLSGTDLALMLDLVRRGAPRAELDVHARRVQRRLNPHPGGQLSLNVPKLDGERLRGMQHKYRETVLFFPSSGQTCHAYCTYCFRWAQFVGIEELRFATKEVDDLVRYLRKHREVTSVLLTGGDPLIMRAGGLRRYLEPLLDPSLEHVESIRIGTKAPAYWPQRFVTDPDSDELLALFEQVGRAGRHLALMAHFSHPRELEPRLAQEALRRIRGTGAVIRCQAPIVRHVNDDPAIWASMWRLQVRSGAVPYYMFVERDTGPRAYFEVPLVRALSIFNRAYRSVSGLARTVRGPSMSAAPGKVVLDAVTQVHGEKVLALRFLQARDPSRVGQMFFARYDERATWLDDLRPAFGERRFFFEPGGDEMPRSGLRLVSSAGGE